jgi:hypothetical protein
MSGDPFDPRYLDFDWPSYLHAASGERALVDYEDYLFFVQWQWRFKKSRNSHKGYLFRTVKVKIGASFQSVNQWLHVEIMKRTGIEPPSPLHTLVDHIDNDQLNCRRLNLRWATPSENAFSREHHKRMKAGLAPGLR